MVTGRQPNLSKMHVFGTICYSYEVDKKKLDNRCSKGIFIGYDKYSPAYLVYHSDSDKIMKHRYVKFTEKFMTKVGDDNPNFICNNHLNDNDDVFPGIIHNDVTVPIGNNGDLTVPIAVEDAEINEQDVNIPIETEIINVDNETIVTEGGRYPIRERRSPQYLAEYVVDDKVYNVDFCYRVGDITIPKTYIEATRTPESNQWKAAMDEEMSS